MKKSNKTNKVKVKSYEVQAKWIESKPLQFKETVEWQIDYRGTTHVLYSQESVLTFLNSISHNVLLWNPLETSSLSICIRRVLRKTEIKDTKNG